MLLGRIELIVFFWSGVLVTRFSEIFSRQDSSKDLEITLNRIENKLSFGQIGIDEFHRLLNPLFPTVNPDQIQSSIISKVKSTSEIGPLLSKLDGEYELKLIAMYPPAWVMAILDQTSQDKFFTEGDCYFIDEQLPFENYSSLMNNLIEKKFVKPGNSLLVDHHPLRTSAAIRAGLDAAIFVDSSRLNRDLSTLWGLY